MRQAIKKFRKFYPSCLGVIFFFISCSKTPLQRNPYLVDIRFQREINLSLPSYNSLTFVGGSVLVPDAGINGIILFNLNGTTFLAWEATCPNHLPRTCSNLEIKGVLAECGCESYQYSLATGQLLNPSQDLDPPQGLLFYQVQNLNGTLRVNN